jgi:hypothetical protein
VYQISTMDQSKKDGGVIATKEFKDLVFQQLDQILCQLKTITFNQLLLTGQVLKQAGIFKL